MKEVRCDETAIPTRTDQEHLNDFIIRSVHAGHYNLAKLFIDREQNLLSAFYKIQSKFLGPNKPIVDFERAIERNTFGRAWLYPKRSKYVQPGFNASLYYHELRRVLAENVSMGQKYLFLYALIKEFLAALETYKDELFKLPRVKFQLEIQRIYLKFISDRKRKLTETLYEQYGSMVDSDSEAEIWFDNQYYSITRGEPYLILHLKGIAHYTEELLKSTKNPKEKEIIVQLIEDSKLRDKIIERLFSTDYVDSTSEDFKQLNIILLKIDSKFYKIRNLFIEKQLIPILPDGESYWRHSTWVRQQFDELVQKYFTTYNFELSYSDNVLLYNGLADKVIHLHEDLQSIHTRVVEHLNAFLAHMFPLNEPECISLRHFLGCNKLTVEIMGNLGSRVQPINAVVDRQNNNLLHVVLQRARICMPFVIFLTKQRINIFSKNKEGKRPLDLVAENCRLLPFDIYKLLIEYTIDWIRPLCLNPEREIQVDAARVVIEKMFGNIVDYVENKHFFDVKKIGDNKLGCSYEVLNDAIKIAEGLSFFYSLLYGLPNNTPIDIQKRSDFSQRDPTFGFSTNSMDKALNPQSGNNPHTRSAYSPSFNYSNTSNHEPYDGDEQEKNKRNLSI